MLKTIEGLAVIQARNLLKQRFDFIINKMIEDMDRLAVFQGSKVVEIMVRFSNLENDLNYG